MSKTYLHVVLLIISAIVVLDMLNSVRWKIPRKIYSLAKRQRNCLFLAYTLCLLGAGYLLSNSMSHLIIDKQIEELEIEGNTNSIKEFKKEDITTNISQQFFKLKAYESQVRKKVDALNDALNDLDRAEMLYEDDAPKKGKIFIIKGAAGGGYSPSSEIFRDWEAKTKNKKQIESNKKNDNKVSLLNNDLDQAISRLNSMPIGSPVTGTLSSEFGWRNSPFSRSKKSHFHQGVDISADAKTPINSTADGVVLYAGDYGAYGRVVIVAHKSGFETLYAHLSKVAVSSGQKICRGQNIGAVGTSGNSTGPHLHYEVRYNGSALNPQKYVESAKVIKQILQQKYDA